MVCVVFGRFTTELDSLDKTLKQIHYFQAYLFSHCIYVVQFINDYQKL